MSTGAMDDDVELPLLVDPLRLADPGLPDRGLRAGGQADDMRLCTGPDLEQYVYKRYSEDTIAGMREKMLIDMVRWRRELPAEERAELDRRCAWPVAAVGGPGYVQGILIRLAPPAMFEQHTLPDGRTRVSPRHLDVLTRGPERARRIGTTYYEPPYKLAVLGQLLSTVNWLHTRGYAVGDLQLRNAVFTVDPRPEVFLLDCDSCVPLSGVGALARVDPEIYQLPEGMQGAAFDANSDYYKFAWAVVRCVQENAETFAIDQEVLKRVMTTPYVELLAECCRTLPPQGTRERLREAAALWPRLVAPGRLSVNIDGYIKEPWPPGRSAVVAKPPITASRPQATIPAPRIPAERATERTPAQRRATVIVLALMVFVVILIVVTVLNA
ncbi:hypothetical protein [Rhizohabitans arisaemae]|uniref:hypothetical protein n=1 Tax=Rhizohabitans arisaemae TaxID=2720610 RepID=UPI0024B05F53|nr:hypothetical protein [Rhizohabitans arisaemae]